ncbi:MAG: SDR family oxidoreductase [Cyclobacteriaceae bacterium]|nr:SDR family oxidoreductase [Cyclobacteriaceae bacterium]
MNKLAVISGGTKGIGQALVEKFAENGFAVATCARTGQDLERLSAMIGKKFPGTDLYTFSADLSDSAERENFIDYVVSLKRPVDVLINNTGIFKPGQIYNEPRGTLEELIGTNLYSAYHLTRGLIGGMIRRREGYIFNICSTASIVAYTNGGSYGISKFALLGMSKVLREEMKSFNIRVSAVLPGATYTASWEGTDLPPERFIKAEDVAEVIWNAYSLSPRTVVEEILIRPMAGDL